MKIAISLLPVLLFLILFLSLDSYRLIRWSVLTVCLLWGAVSACFSLAANTTLAQLFHLSFGMLSQFIAPFTEEVLKLLILLWLIYRHRIGFSIDACIYGFAVGTGFALVENTLYLFQLRPGDTSLWVWIIRGFGTAVMHGGVTAIAGLILVNRLTRNRNLVQPFILALMVAYLLHAFYNTTIFSPLLSSLLMTVFVTAILLITFRVSDRSLSQWIELGMDAELSLLIMIRKGTFSRTRAGEYLLSVKDHFPREIVVDMYCYIGLYLELSLKTKSMMLLREQDLPVPMDPGIREKLTELDALRRQIGKAGMLALKPVLRFTRRDIWALSALDPR